ncbi:MAG: asparaginase [Pirellulaceae bacterium]
MKRICIFNTGGTIGMKPTPQGLRPVKGFLAEQMKLMQELSDDLMPDFEIVEYDPVIDSANMTPGHWQQIAQDIASRFAQFDGFVVLHGTDTMAYTSSALPFMMPNLSKPVVLTGSQLPLGQIRSDGRENLKTAMVIAANFSIPEVGLFFGEALYRGCRATKISASRLDAFDSPNYLPLAAAETSIEVFEERLRKVAQPASTTLAIQEIRATEIATFRLFPGMSTEVLKNVLHRPLKALILESYGVGNGPSLNRDFLATIASASRDNIVIVNCTQCRHGCVLQHEYEVGRMLEDSGVVSGRDLTIEAAIAKLLYLFTNHSEVAEIRRLVLLNLVGELTEAH